MIKILRILGKKGRVTIPYDIRKIVGFKYNDVLSFEIKDDNTVIVKREVLCDENCPMYENENQLETENITLTDFLDGLTPEEQKTALIHLSANWALQQGGGNNA